MCVFLAFINLARRSVFVRVFFVIFSFDTGTDGDRANLFTTPEARDQLFKEAGVVFVKDSSANKCGVICSSFEIISSMLMTTDEFMESKVRGTVG